MMKNTSNLAINGLVAAMYVVLTIVPALIPAVGQYLYGPIQFRISELLCILPFFLPNTKWGLFIGCAAANYIGMGLGLTMPIDIFVGSFATLLAAYITTKISSKWLVPLPTVLANGIIVGCMLAILMPMPQVGFAGTALLFGFQVALGEFVVCYGLGIPFLFMLEKRGFKKSNFLNRMSQSL